MPGWIEQWLLFIGIMLLGQFSPGPDMVLLTRTALAAGRKAGCWTAVGIACGLSIHAGVAVTGVATLLAKGGWLEQGVKWLAAGYFVWLGVQLIRSGVRRGELRVGGAAQVLDGGSWASWRRGLLCNLLNPKVMVFLVGVTAPFLAINEAPWFWPGLLWGTILLEGLVLWCLWVVVLQWGQIKMRYLKAAHWFDFAFGVALLVVAGVLVCGG